MPQINDPNAQEALAVLRTYVEQCGGEGSAIDGWTTELYSRSIGNSAGTTDRYFFDASGKKFRSRAEIARALGLSGAPAIRVKGDGTTSTGVLRPGEAPATFKYEWGDQTERTFEESANAFRVEGDFREFDARDAMGAEVSLMYRRQPKRWRDVLENQYVWPAKREPQTQSSEWPRCNCVYDPSNPEGGCAGTDCVNRELYVECPLDCCMGGAPDPACASTTEVVLEKFDKVRDRKGLEAKMASDGWTTEEKQRDGSTHVDRYFISPDQSRFRSIIEIARSRYPEFLLDTEEPLGVGSFVTVTPDTSPGNNRQGGGGTIMAMHDDGSFDIKPGVGGGLWRNVTKEDISRESSQRRSRRSEQPKQAKKGGGRLPCANTVIQRRAYPPVEVYDTGTMGFGLRGRVAIHKGQKIGEYRGEVVDQNELLERRCKRKAEDPFYIAALGDGLSIDAGSRGGYARFANHSSAGGVRCLRVDGVASECVDGVASIASTASSVSTTHRCAPNCKLEKWRVGEEPRLVLVALRDIPPQEELCYDYNAGGTEADATVGQECKCGAPNCIGVIGSKKNVVKSKGYQSGSDDDDEPAKGRAARAKRRAGEDEEPPPPRKNTREPVWTLEDVMALEEAVESGMDFETIVEETLPGRTADQLERKYDELRQVKQRREPKGTPKKKKQKLQEDGPESLAWAARTHLELIGTEGGAPELAEALYGAATRHEERQGKGDLHCFCRLPEFPEVPCVSTDGDAAELLFCDACAGWVHPRCIRLETMPGDDDDYICPLCAYSRGDGVPLATVATRNGKVLWKRALSDAVSLEQCEKCLNEWEALEIDDGLVYAGLAKNFLETIVSEAKAFAERAAPFLVKKDTLTSAKLRGLAELVCEGQTLELVDDTLLDSLRDGLRCAALAAREVSPENA